MQFIRFEPLHKQAKVNIDELIKRGGLIIVEKREYVEIKRYESIAKIDQWGRVEWRNEVN